MELTEEFSKRSLKIQKVVRNGINLSMNAFFDDGKLDQESLHSFPDLNEIDAKAKEADRVIGEIMLKTMEGNQLPQPLYQLLEKQKSETQAILKEYDDIIFQLNSTLSLKEMEYRKKIEKQSFQHQMIRERIDDIISELNRVGKEEISSIRKTIVDHSECISDNLSIENEGVFEETSVDNVLESGLWKGSARMFTLQKLEDSFLNHQKETLKLRRKLLCEVCKLRNELEKEKMNYNLKKQVFEQEIFYLSEKHYRGIPILSKMKLKCIKLQDIKNNLCNELKEINELFEKENKVKEKQSFKKQSKELDIRYATEGQSSKYHKIFEERNSEAYILHSKILTSVEFIFKNILKAAGLPSNPIPQGMNTSKIEQNYWEHFLCTTLDDPLIDEILKLMEEYWLEWKTYSKLKELKKSLMLQSINLNNFFKLYNKYKSV